MAWEARHRHTREDEYSYILEGRVGALLGDEVLVGGPGDLIFKPRNQWHTFWNAGDEPARVLEIISPAGFERFFAELAGIGGVTGATPEALADLRDRYGQQVDPGSIPGLIDRFGGAHPRRAGLTGAGSGWPAASSPESMTGCCAPAPPGSPARPPELTRLRRAASACEAAINQPTRQSAIAASQRPGRAGRIAAPPARRATRPAEGRTMDTWQKFDAERVALCDDLASIEPGQWDVQSLCSAWKIRHVVCVARRSPWGLRRRNAQERHELRPLHRPAGAGGRDGTAAGASGRAEGHHREAVGSTDDHAGHHAFRHRVSLSRHAPAARDQPYAARRNPDRGGKQRQDDGVPVRARKRIAGLRLVATDATWSAGDGPQVGGPLESLILAMAGRPAALEDLSGTARRPSRPGADRFQQAPTSRPLRASRRVLRRGPARSTP